MKNIKVTFLVMSLFAFISCSEDKDITAAAPSALIQSIIPSDYKVVNFNEIKEANLVDNDKKVVLVESIPVDKDKQAFLKNLLIDKHIPLLLKGKEAIEFSYISGIENINGNDGLALLYNNPQKGIEVRTFSDAIATISLDGKNENARLSSNVSYESLESQSKDITQSFNEAFEIVRTESSYRNSRLAGVGPDLSKYKIRTYYSNLNMSPTTISKYQNFVKKTISRTVPTDIYKYRVATVIAQGSTLGQKTDRTFVDVTFIGNPGFRSLTKNVPHPMGPNFRAASMTGVTWEFMLKSHFPSSFSYDSFAPLSSSGGSGSYSVPSVSVSVNANQSGGGASITVPLNQAYSYSVPDFYFTNQTDGYTGMKTTFWSYKPGNCKWGAFNRGNGLVSFRESDIFCRATTDVPIPMRQTNNISATLLVSRPYQKTDKSISLIHEVRATVADPYALANHIVGWVEWANEIELSDVLKESYSPHF